jgi:hypothetical protein
MKQLQRLSQREVWNYILNMKKYELLSTHTARRSFATNQYEKISDNINNEDNWTHYRKIIYEIHKDNSRRKCKNFTDPLG